MAFTAMTRLQVRRRVQNLMRDDGFPNESINEAIARIIADINNSGRYRFQEGYTDVTLVTGTASYALTTAPFIGEIDVIYNPGYSTSTNGIREMAYNDALAEGRFNTATDKLGVPEIYSLPGDMSTIYVDPVPSTDANGKTLRVVGYKDIVPYTNDITALTILPPRYHEGLLVYGALAEVAPAIQVSSGTGYVPAEMAYQRAFQQMQKQEKWRALVIPQIRRDTRWADIGLKGNVGGVRGSIR